MIMPVSLLFYNGPNLARILAKTTPTLIFFAGMMLLGNSIKACIHYFLSNFYFFTK